VGLDPVTRVRVDDGLIEVLFTQVVSQHILGQNTELAAVHRVRKVADPVNLVKGLVGQVHLVKLGGGGVAAIESLVSTSDGGHFGDFGVGSPETARHMTRFLTGGVWGSDPGNIRASYLFRKFGGQRPQAGSRGGSN